jgi:ribosome-associated translation inhibitor RaiA
MESPLQITFRHMESSPALAARIRQRADELDQFFGRIVSCRVVVECHHMRHRQGGLFEVHIDLTVPGAELVSSRDHGLDHAHEDAHVAVRDAFNAARRRLEDFARERRDAAIAHSPRKPLPAEPADLPETSDEDR